jgi:hypothetical protein
MLLGCIAVIALAAAQTSAKAVSKKDASTWIYFKVPSIECMKKQAVVCKSFFTDYPVVTGGVHYPGGKSRTF